MPKQGRLSFQPVQLVDMGHTGTAGSMGDTSNILRSTLAQNIVYAVYKQPLTIHELAEELGTAAVFIEDELNFLMAYDYVAEVASGKYTSKGIVLWDLTAKQMEELNVAYQDCAAEIADATFDALTQAQAQIENSGLVYPNKDFNFLLWTLLPKTIDHQANRARGFSLDFDRAAPKRSDGGQYIASASIYRLKESTNTEEYYTMCGPMIRNAGSSVGLWQVNTYWSNRGDWRTVNYDDVECYQRYQKGELPDDETHLEDYAFLLEKQYILRTAQGYEMNVVWVETPETWRTVTQLIPDLSAVYGPAVNRLYEQSLAITMRDQPEHVRPLIDYLTKIRAVCGPIIPYVLKRLVDSGKLHEPLPQQRKTITTLMGFIN